MATIAITAPSSAEEGERVSVSVKVTNTLAKYAPFKTTIYAVPYLYPDYVIGGGTDVIKSGESKTYSASFTMPDCKVTAFVWVEHWDGYHWTYYGSDSKVVSLEVAPATFHLSVFVPSWAYGGYVEPGSGDYPANTTITLRAHPLSGYQFVSWGRDASGTSPTYNLYMNSDKNVEAYFEKVPVPEYPDTDIKEIAISVLGPEFPPTGIDHIAISVLGPEYPSSDLDHIAISVLGPEYPSSDLDHIAISVVGVEYPSSDLDHIAISVLGPEYPSSDLDHIAISVLGPEYPSSDLDHIAIRVIPVGYIPPIDGGFVKIEITKPLPSSGIFGVTYKIEGSAKMFDIVGALPWLYAAVKKKEWYLPEIIEEVSYERGFPIPISGDFSIDFKPEKGGDYEVTIVATPAPLPLPVVGVLPVVGESGMMKIKVE